MKWLRNFIAAPVVLLLLGAFPTPVDAQKSGVSSHPQLEVIQFHLEHRCVSCTNIEKFTRATLAAHYPSIPFRLVAVEKKENAKLAEQFEASGTSLFLYNKKTGAKKNLTQFAFLQAGNEPKFQAGLMQEIEAFEKQ
ncbi:MAG: nitrophenyl compound nitroreductase subunit ArsF family protein [Chitinophagaceae bacterium]|jgi:hypothetical protein|nr:nitrophenyl compound nitroreductase subunit ArsF family protein [Chitinophagaceae bacterium]